MTSFRGQASWAKIMSREGKLTAPACHPTKKIIKLSNEPISPQTLYLVVTKVTFTMSVLVDKMSVGVLTFERKSWSHEDDK